MKGNSEFAAGENFDDLLFENRHKAYGAYQLRKSYERRLTFSALTTAGVFVLSLLGFQYSSVADSPETSRPQVESVVFIEPPSIVIENPDVPKGGGIPETEAAASDYQIVDRTVATPPPAPLPYDPDLSGLAPTLPGPFNGPAGLPGGDPNAGSVLAAKKVITDTQPKEREEEIEGFADIDPYFPDYNAYLQQHLRYPQSAADIGLQGSVILKFVVEKDGSITHIEVEKALGMGCTEEAKRVIANMPRWKPGTIDGQPVRVTSTITVNFKLER